MCGIIAILQQQDDASIRQKILTSLHHLENRGYDSAGVAVINSHNCLQLAKYAEPEALQRVSDASAQFQGCVAVGHTRWATHGARTDINAHPHVSDNGRFILVHNGIIQNYAELKAQLTVPCQSQTDTEVIVQLMEQNEINENTILEAWKTTISQLQGTWGLVCLDRRNPHCLLVARRGSPLLIGFGSATGKAIYVGSEPLAFQAYTKQFIELVDGEVMRLTFDDTVDQFTHRIKQIIPQLTLDSPAPYEHWMLREIHEQPQTVCNVLNCEYLPGQALPYIGRLQDKTHIKLGGLEAQLTNLLQIKDLLIVACGSSLHAGLWAESLFYQLGNFRTVKVLDAVQFQPYHVRSKHTGILFLSQSGESRDIIEVIECIKLHLLEVQMCSIVNVVGSQLARLTGCGVYLNAGREVAVAATKSFTSQCVALSLVALWFAQQRQIKSDLRSTLITSLRYLPMKMYANLQTSSEVWLQKLISCLHTSCFLLGRGQAESIAREAALKIKEIAYVHAEAFHSGALKHGPLALIDSQAVVIFILLQDEYYQVNLSAVHEIKARGGQLFVITDSPALSAGESGRKLDLHSSSALVLDISQDRILVVPSSGHFSSLQALVPLQLLSYRLAVQKSYNPDKPRNLAKTVTVE